MSTPPTQVRSLVLAIGGATSSGKTLLAGHVASALPNCLTIHQDDFAPDEASLPLKNGVQDWDAPATAIDWPLFRRALKHTRGTGEQLPEVPGHDHLNKLETVEVDEGVLSRWKDRLGGLVEEEKREGVQWRFVLVDGFLLYYDQDCNAQYDVRVLLRVPREIIKARREARAQYVVQTGDVWTDPPGYFDDIVYPAYVEAHEKMFVGGDVEQGKLAGQWREAGAADEGEGPEEIEQGKGKGKAVEGDKDSAHKTPVVLLEPADGSEGMEMMVDRTLGLVFDAIKRI